MGARDPAGGGVHSTATPLATSSAPGPSARRDGACTARDATGESAETRPPTRARAATRTCVPGAGSGPVSRTGLSRRGLAAAGPGDLREVSLGLRAQDLDLQRLEGDAPGGGAWRDVRHLQIPPALRQREPCHGLGRARKGASGSPRLPHAGREARKARAQAARSRGSAAGFKE
jgi:hypothetical protein